MDFFESQELARKKTRWLVFLFVLAVLAIFVAIYVLVVVATAMATQSTGSSFSAIATDWRLILGTMLGVLGVIGMGSFSKMVELRHGGAAVAALMGGRRVVGNSRLLTDRRVANVVEEMALASGTPVPPVYIMDNEEGINAFAAGYTIDDAIIGINRGTAEKLTREELQGVVAHEFSHILNGDMRMSLRMVAILNGILLISIIGAQLLELLTRHQGVVVQRPSRSKEDQQGQAAFKIILLLIAVGLYLIGSIGLFFGRLIKSTVSRQREYLADASAVQFTRLPEGISGALKMIGGTAGHSLMRAANAEQISHMFFSSAKANLLFATHPPLLDRIRKIEPKFDGDYRKFIGEREKRLQLLQGDDTASAESKQEKKKSLFDFLPGIDNFEMFEKMKLPINPLILITGIGIPTTDDVEYSGFMVDEIPTHLLKAIRETFSARCVVFASLLSSDSQIRQSQLAGLQQREARGSVELTLQVKPWHDQLPIHLRLGAFEIIQGTLSAMSPAQYPLFRQSIQELIDADQQVDLFEFFLFHHLIVHLDRCFKPQPKRQNQFTDLPSLRREVAELLSLLATVGNDQAAVQKTAFQAAWRAIYDDADWESSFIPLWDHRRLSAALHKLAFATPVIKKKVLSAAVIAIAHDNELTVQEVELFRAMSESIDCPVPPLIATRRESPSLPDPGIELSPRCGEKP